MHYAKRTWGVSECGLRVSLHLPTVCTAVKWSALQEIIWSGCCSGDGSSGQRRQEAAAPGRGADGGGAAPRAQAAHAGDRPRRAGHAQAPVRRPAAGQGAVPLQR
jgi:hypothetical protein